MGLLAKHLYTVRGNSGIASYCIYMFPKQSTVMLLTRHHTRNIAAATFLHYSTTPLHELTSVPLSLTCNASDNSDNARCSLSNDEGVDQSRSPSGAPWWCCNCHPITPGIVAYYVESRSNVDNAGTTQGRRGCSWLDMKPSTHIGIPDSDSYRSLKAI